jgi:TM2 domain-containing membrane protein YozV
MNNIMMKKGMTTEQLAMVASELERKKKSKGIMYALWWFTGALGGHRYYLGDIGIAIGMTLTFGGLGIWSLIDVFMIGKRLEEKTRRLEEDMINEVKLYSDAE